MPADDTQDLVVETNLGMQLQNTQCMFKLCLGSRTLAGW
jgi:hypothetical protein